MNNQIQTAYINALLADAAYVDANSLATDLPERMTPAQAAYLAANFEVVSAINTSDIPLVGSGFDAMVWRGKAGTEFAGKIFVSMRGTEPLPGGADLLADADLALTDGALSQIIDMVKWWLRETTPVGLLAEQIKWDPLRQPDPGSVQIIPGFVSRAFLLYQFTSRSGVAPILWMLRSAPSNSSSWLRRSPSSSLSRP